MRLFSKAILTLALASQSVFANTNANNGVYVGGSLNIANYQTPSGAALMSFFISAFPHQNIYFSPIVGYRINDYFAIESSANRLADNSSSTDGFWGANHFKLYTVDLSAKFIWPFHSGISLFALPGIAFAHQDTFNQVFVHSPILVDEKTNRLLPQLGVGASYNFTKNIALTAFYKHAFGISGVSDINIGGFGLTYTFGVEENNPSA